MRKSTSALLIVSICLAFISCDDKKPSAVYEVESDSLQVNKLVGTWKLITGTLIEKGDTTVTDYTKTSSFIKIINATHFAFIQHDLQKGKDSTASFSAGGGTYSLKDSSYTEHLEYCNAREWEGHDFNFTVTISNDTLVQRGIEVVESQNINRLNIEKYVRAR
ncbi:MAG: hypothetical protein EOO02_10145 [Chitinophagaceae bacterium]|nr:MAG: hypothetical protein EOO02_10145 [Chitinophagaceae bacterium]